MASNIDVTPNKNENSASLLRRFTRAFRETGITHAIRAGRYYKRSASDLRRKKSKLHRIDDSKKYTKLRKEGKM